MCTIDQLVSLDELLNSYECLSGYRESLYSAINKLHDDILADSIFPLQVKQKLNSRQDVFDRYCELLDNAMIKHCITKSGNMFTYNILRDDYIFYVKWREELFNCICKEFNRTDWVRA